MILGRWLNISGIPYVIQELMSLLAWPQMFLLSLKSCTLDILKCQSRTISLHGPPEKPGSLEELSVLKVEAQLPYKII